MKTKFLVIIFLLLSFIFQFCSKEGNDQTQIDQDPPDQPTTPTPPKDTWEQATTFPGTGREQAFSFVIGNKFYVGMGSGFINSRQQELSDFYEYDVATKTWAKKADVPTDGHLAAISFSINGKGYVGLGFRMDCPTPNAGCTPVLSKDIWEYDPTVNTWKKVATLDKINSSVGIQTLTSFVAYNKVYIVAGTELWQFDPANNTVTAKSSCPEPMSGPASFALNNKGYVTTAGITDFFQTQEFSKRFYQYDPLTDLWTRKADFAGEDRNDALGFALKGKGFIGCGEGSKPVSATQTQIVPLKDVWSYDAEVDKWTRVKDYPGQGLFKMVAAAMSNQAVVGTGSSSGIPFPNDFWHYKPE